MTCIPWGKQGTDRQQAWKIMLRLSCIVLCSAAQENSWGRTRDGQAYKLLNHPMEFNFFFTASFIQPNIQSDMVRKAHSKITPTTNGPEDIQMDIDKDPEVKKHRHNTDTEDPPRKKVQHLLIITVKHSLADHDIWYIDKTKY